MPVVVNTNTQSIFAQRALSGNTLNLQRNIERLSTGFRINRAADDAAGLSISEKLTTRIRGFDKAKQNAADGISFVQTAEGALGIVQENLQRIRELVVQGINGTNSSNEKDALQRELNERVQIISDISTEAQFNGVLLLTGTANADLQTGSDSGQITSISLESGLAAQTGMDIDTTFAVTGGATTDGGQLVEGVEFADGSAAIGFTLEALHIEGATGVDSLAGAGNNINISVNTATPAADIELAAIDVMIDNVSRMRSELGATQNALESRILYMDVARENALASRSRIKDVDVAKESSMLVKNQILQQTASAMLSQANQTPQIALQLLGG